MQTIIQNIKTHYIVEGNGYPIVLLHGWGCETKTFESLSKHLKQYFKVFRLDFPGFGQTNEPPEPWDNDNYVQFTKAFLQEFQIENPIILGHSFGGRVALKLATELKFKKLILTGSAGIKPKRSLSYHIKVRSYKLVKVLAKIPLLNLIFEPIRQSYIQKVGSTDYKSASTVMRQTLSKVVNTDLEPILQQISVPTLLIWGEHDSATPVSNAKILEKNIKDAGLVVLPGSGHYVFLEKLQEFLIIADKFLEQEKENA